MSEDAEGCHEWTVYTWDGLDRQILDPHEPSDDFDRAVNELRRVVDHGKRSDILYRKRFPGFLLKLAPKQNSADHFSCGLLAICNLAHYVLDLSLPSVFSKISLNTVRCNLIYAITHVEEYRKLTTTRIPLPQMSGMDMYDGHDELGMRVLCGRAKREI